jgi:hypothetical protein
MTLVSERKQSPLKHSHYADPEAAARMRALPPRDQAFGNDAEKELCFKHIHHDLSEQDRLLRRCSIGCGGLQAPSRNIMISHRPKVIAWWHHGGLPVQSRRLTVCLLVVTLGGSLLHAACPDPIAAPALFFFPRSYRSCRSCRVSLAKPYYCTGTLGEAKGHSPPR